MFQLNKHTSKLLVSTAVLILVLTASSYTQAQVVTANDGFEGVPEHNIPPPGWNNCNDGYSTVDTQPGILHNVLTPSEGSSYISIVTRGMNPGGTTETVWADLLIPFQKDKCYTITLDLSLSETFYGTLIMGDFYFNNPCRLEVFGFNGDFENSNDKELLWESGNITNFNWQTTSIKINPKNNSYNRIAFRTEFISPGEIKNSALMVDHLQLTDSIASFALVNGDLHIPQNSRNIQWYFNGDMLPGATGTSMPEMGAGLYQAVFESETGCQVILEEFYAGNPDWVAYYPNPASNQVYLKFVSDGNGPVILTIYTATGQQVKETKLVESAGNFLITVDLTGLVTGYYQMKLSRPGRNPNIMKLVIVHNY